VLLHNPTDNQIGLSFLHDLQACPDRGRILVHYNSKLEEWVLGKENATDVSGKMALMYGYHVQMCINSVALTESLQERYIVLVEKAAKAVIDLREDYRLQYTGEVGPDELRLH
jgi:hypothetical protein